MTYGGESWAKKLARIQYWKRAHSLVGTDAFLSARYLVLCGPDAGDAKCLVGMGVDPTRIVAVDTDRAALDSACAFKGPEYVHGDVRGVARKMRGRFAHVFLDLCSTIGPASAKLVAQTGAFALRENGILGSGFMYGRETAPVMRRVREWAPGVATWVGAHKDAGRAIRSCDDPDMVGQTEDTLKEQWTKFLADEPAKASRSLVANKYVRDAAIAVGFGTLCVGQCFYRSTKTRPDGTRAGVPMIYTMHMVERLRGRDPAWWYGAMFANAVNSIPDDPDGSLVRQMAINVARGRTASSAEVAMLLNLSRQQLAAWLAVDTRERKASAA